MKRLAILVTSLLLLESFVTPVNAQSATVKVISEGATNSPIELAIQDLPGGINPYDAISADVKAKITFASGKSIEIPLFWYQEFQNFQTFNDFNSKKIGEPEWRLRFRALESGNLNISFYGAIDGQSVTIPDYSMKVNYQVQTPITISGRGFYQGDTPFVPIAYNIAWAGRYKELIKYKQWFKAASEGGVNVARVWMAAWSMGIEWADTGLGNYNARLQNAWTLDQVFKLASQYGIRIQLVLLNHGAFSESTNPEWFSSPYNQLNGGPLASPAEFATNPIAIKYWQQRLRYIAARYAAYPNLFAWEWWNEVNFTPISQDDLSKWMTDSRTYLNKFDPYKTLITTSWSTAGNVRDWDPVDFASVHVYDSNDPVTVLRNVADSMKEYLPNKPTVLGEMGSGTLTEDPFADPTGLHLHNAQWAATFLGFNSPASYWWWDTYVDPLNLWGHTKGLAKLISGLDLVKMNQIEIPSIVSTRTFLLQNEQTTIGWTRLNTYTLSAKKDFLLNAAIAALKSNKPLNTNFQIPKSKGGTLRIPVVKNGNYTVAIMNALTGKVLTTAKSVATKNSISVKLPAFTGDISFKVSGAGA
mgnify:CR=1 FL=1